jgi:hypothetical protein
VQLENDITHVIAKITEVEDEIKKGRDGFQHLLQWRLAALEEQLAALEEQLAALEQNRVLLLTQQQQQQQNELRQMKELQQQQPGAVPLPC